jgi:hypothetical protein
MIDTHIDEIARALGRPELNRRAAIAAGIAGALGAVLGLREVTAGVGCRNAGKTCRRGDECCSGICKGKRGKRTCRAHGAGTCRAGANYCREGLTAVCNGSAECLCFVTTGAARFCGAKNGTVCAACRKDTDCDAVTGPGSACIEATERPFCGCDNLGFGTACIAPCEVGPQPILSPRENPR